MANKSKSQKNNASDISTRTVIQIIFLVGYNSDRPPAYHARGISKGGAFDVFCPFGAVETFWSFITTGQTLKTTSPLNFSIFLGVSVYLCWLDGLFVDGCAPLAHSRTSGKSVQPII